MKIAILEPNPGQLAVYADVYCEFQPDLFRSYFDFKRTSKNPYDVIILSHRIDGFSWKEIYNELNNQTTKFIVTSTFKPEEYKGLEPDIYQQLKEVRGFKNVQLKLKDEYRKIYDLIDTKKTLMGIREIALGLLVI